MAKKKEKHSCILFFNSSLSLGFSWCFHVGVWQMRSRLPSRLPSRQASRLPSRLSFADLNGDSLLVHAFECVLFVDFNKDSLLFMPSKLYFSIISTKLHYFTCLRLGLFRRSQRGFTTCLCLSSISTRIHYLSCIRICGFCWSQRGFTIYDAFECFFSSISTRIHFLCVCVFFVDLNEDLPLVMRSHL